MKKIILVLLVISSLNVFSQRTCATTEKMNELIANNPSLAIHHQETMDYLQNPSTAQSNKNANVVVTIPVVFHVLYKTSIQNISNVQIDSQLAILNNDFRKLN